MIYRLKLEHKARTLFLINSFPPNSLMTSDTQCFPVQRMSPGIAKEVVEICMERLVVRAAR